MSDFWSGFSGVSVPEAVADGMVSRPMRRVKALLSLGGSNVIRSMGTTFGPSAYMKDFCIVPNTGAAIDGNNAV